MPIRGSVDLSIVRKMLNKNLVGFYSNGLRAVIMGTPADTGMTRNSWFLTVDTPLGLGSSRGEDRSGSGSLASITESMPNEVIGKKIYLTNNSPAIISLEYGGYPSPVKKGSYDKATKSYVALSAGGFSLQAPGGWVRGTIINMKRTLASL